MFKNLLLPLIAIHQLSLTVVQIGGIVIVVPDGPAGIPEEISGVVHALWCFKNSARISENLRYAFINSHNSLI